MNEGQRSIIGDNQSEEELTLQSLQETPEGCSEVSIYSTEESCLTISGSYYTGLTARHAGV